MPEQKTMKKCFKKYFKWGYYLIQLNEKRPNLLSLTQV
jgi:hypothetical protein